MSKNTNSSSISHTSNHHHHHSSSSASSSRTSSSTTQACAACKYQRRRCNPDCQLAPYFPADHQRQFLNAHRLYGVSNILKILKKLDSCYHAEAMRTIIFESDTRAQYPVGGCYQLILELNRICEHLMNELAITLHHIELHRTQQALVMQQSDEIYGNDVMAAQAQQAQQQQQQQQCFDYFCFDGNNDDVTGLNVNIGNGNGNGNDSEIKGNDSGSVGNNYNAGNGGEVDVDFFNMQQQHNNNNNNNNNGCVVVDDVKPLIDVFDITNALDIVDEDVGEITSKVADIDIVPGSASYQCSSEEPRKDEVNSMGQILQEHDLKGAASLFTLTSRDSSYV